MPNVPLSEATKNGFVAAATKIAQVNDAATSAGLTAAQARTDVVTVKSDVKSIKTDLLTAQGDVSLVKNDVSALKLDNSSLAQRLDAVEAAIPVVPVADTTDFAALLDPVGGGVGGGASQSQVDALQAKVDAMPALAVVTDPAQAPVGTIAVVAIP